MKRILFVLAVILLAVSFASATDYNFSLTNGTNTVTFTLPSSPTGVTPLQSPGGFEITGVSSNVGTLTLDFFTTGFLGGFEGYLNPPTVLFNQSGVQLYTGPDSTPTFITGTFILTDCVNSGSINCLGPGETGPTYTGNYTLTIGEATATPEPASMLLLGSGLLGLGGLARRKK